MDDPAQVASVAAMMDDTRQEHGMSEVRTLTLTEFLTARLDETQKWGEAFALDAPARAYILGDVEAKRQIVEISSPAVFDGVAEPGGGLPDVLRLLASVYSGHPDYNPDWRP